MTKTIWIAVMVWASLLAYPSAVRGQLPQSGASRLANLLRASGAELEKSRVVVLQTSAADRALEPLAIAALPGSGERADHIAGMLELAALVQGGNFTIRRTLGLALEGVCYSTQAAIDGLRSMLNQVEERRVFVPRETLSAMEHMIVELRSQLRLYGEARQLVITYAPSRYLETGSANDELLQDIPSCRG